MRGPVVLALCTASVQHFDLLWNRLVRKGRGEGLLGLWSKPAAGTFLALGSPTTDSPLITWEV